MKPTDIGALVSVADPQLSPDGRHVAYVLNRIDTEANNYRSQVWITRTDGTTPSRPLTAGEHKDGQPRWSPDGTMIAFTSTRATDANGKTRSTLHLLPFEVPGETVLLAEGDEPFVGPEFSPDGAMIAVAQRTRGKHYESDRIEDRPARRIGGLGARLDGVGFVIDRPSHVKLVPTDGSGPLRNVTPGPWECSGPRWFPDGKALAVAVNRFDNAFISDVGIVALDVPDEAESDPTPVRLLTEGTGRYPVAVPAPDGSRVLVVGAEDPRVHPQNARVGLIDTESGTPAPDWRSGVIDRTWAPTCGASAPTFLADDVVLASHEDRGDTVLARLDLATGSVEPLVEPGRAVTGWSARRLDGSDRIVYTAADGTRTAELFAIVDGQSVRLTNHSTSFVTSTRPEAPEHFLVRSGDEEIDAWIIRPRGFDPAGKWPMLLNIHGGPFTQYGNIHFDEFQIQAAAGYVVVYSNPRGSSGRTTAYGQAINGPKHAHAPGTGWASVDYDDLMAVVDTALARFPFIDAARLGVLGGSYGGFMTSWIVTHTDRFAAACTERAVNDILALERGADGATFFSTMIGVTFVEDPAEYRRMSPISYVEDLATPLLIIHSEGDLRCPQDQAWMLFNACQILDKPDVEFVLFPGESHGLSRDGAPKHRIQRAEIIVDFFDRHLKTPDSGP